MHLIIMKKCDDPNSDNVTLERNYNGFPIQSKYIIACFLGQNFVIHDLFYRLVCGPDFKNREVQAMIRFEPYNRYFYENMYEDSMINVFN